MTSKSRKGLQKHGLRSYIIFGVARTVLIERERPRCFRVRPTDIPLPFHYGEYDLLRDARVYAEDLAKGAEVVEPHIAGMVDLAKALPKCLDRRQPRG